MCKDAIVEKEARKWNTASKVRAAYIEVSNLGNLNLKISLNIMETKS